MCNTGNTERYQSYFTESPVAVFVVDDAGDCVDANPAACELVGYSREDLLRMGLAELVVTDQDSETDQVLTELEEDGPVRTHRSVKHKNGEELEVLFEGVALGDDRFLLYCHDITSEREYERQLKAQRDNLTLLNQVVRHDIRNDLQLVTAYAELTGEKSTDEEIQEYAETILENADHAVELTKTARDMAKLMLAGEEERQAINLQGVLESQLEEIRSTYPDAAITTEGSATGVAVEANDMLDSVFRNLLKNAVQHNDKSNPEVTLTVSERDETVRVEVADNGPGIPESQRETVFGKGEAGLDSHGTGVGLYLVQTLVTNYGGDIWIEPNSPTGSVFVVELSKAE